MSERAGPLSTASELRSISGVRSVSEVSSVGSARGISIASVGSAADADDPMGTARWVGGWHAVALHIQAGPLQKLPATS